jgi:hypothetical protein
VLRNQTELQKQQIEVLEKKSLLLSDQLKHQPAPAAPANPLDQNSQEALERIRARSELEQKQLEVLEGQSLFTMYCVQCHNARALAERPFANYETVAAHMRVRANLSGQGIRETPRVLPPVARCAFASPAGRGLAEAAHLLTTDRGAAGAIARCPSRCPRAAAARACRSASRGCRADLTAASAGAGAGAATGRIRGPAVAATPAPASRLGFGTLVALMPGLVLAGTPVRSG